MHAFICLSVWHQLGLLRPFLQNSYLQPSYSRLWHSFRSPVRYGSYVAEEPASLFNLAKLLAVKKRAAWIQMDEYRNRLSGWLPGRRNWILQNSPRFLVSAILYFLKSLPVLSAICRTSIFIPPCLNSSSFFLHIKRICRDYRLNFSGIILHSGLCLPSYFAAAFRCMYVRIFIDILQKALANKFSWEDDGDS